MTADDLLRGDEIDAFVMGAADENGRRFAPLNDTGVTSGASNTACGAPEGHSEPLSAHSGFEPPRHVGDLPVVSA